MSTKSPGFLLDQPKMKKLKSRQKSVVLKDKDASSNPGNRPDRNAREQKQTISNKSANTVRPYQKQFKQNNPKQHHDSKQHYRRYGGRLEYQK